MKFAAREDIEAPIEYVFSQISDFPALERSALRRGADVQRLDDLEEPGEGMRWQANFTLRGKERELKFELVKFDPPNGMILSSLSPNMGGQMVIDLVALSRGRTRLSAELEMHPKNLSARLLVQSMKLAKSNLSKRFRNRLAAYGDDLEERFKSTA